MEMNSSTDRNVHFVKISVLKFALDVSKDTRSLVELKIVNKEKVLHFKCVNKIQL